MPSGISGRNTRSQQQQTNRPSYTAYISVQPTAQCTLPTRKYLSLKYKQSMYLNILFTRILSEIIHLEHQTFNDETFSHLFFVFSFLRWCANDKNGLFIVHIYLMPPYLGRKSCKCTYERIHTIFLCEDRSQIKLIL